MKGITVISGLSAVVLAAGFLLRVTAAAAQTQAIITRDAVADAWELRMAGNTDDAAALLEEELAANNQNAAAHYELARCYLYLWRFGDADDHIAQAVKLDPNNVSYLRFASVVEVYHTMYNMRNPLKWAGIPFGFHKSVNYLEHAVELAPDDDELRYRLLELDTGLPWMLGGSKRDARKAQEVLAMRDPLWGIIAEYRIEHPKSPEEIARYESRLDGLPENALWNYFRGMLCLRAGRHVGALEHFQAAASMDSRYAETMLLVGKGDRPDPESAREAIRLFLDDSRQPAPLRAYAVWQLSTIERRAEHTAAADSLREEALKLDPHVWSTYAPPPVELFTTPE